jgi:fructose-specific phosphotransferase system IIC component
MNQFSNHPLYRRHNIDSALSSLWDFYKKKFVALFLLSLGMSVAIQYASSMVNINEISEITDPELLLEKMKGYLLPILIVTLISLLATTILHYYIIFNPIDSESTVLTSIVRSLKYYIPYLIIMVFLALQH